jgi:hypothetical protein
MGDLWDGFDADRLLAGTSCHGQHLGFSPVRTVTNVVAARSLGQDSDVSANGTVSIRCAVDDHAGLMMPRCASFEEGG